MSDASSSTKKKSGKKSGPKRERRERRFASSAGVDAGIVRLMFAVGAMLLGAGAFGQFVRPSLTPVDADGNPLAALPPLPYAYGLLAAGALVTGIALWIGSSGGAAMRVGDGGVALEKGEIIRLAWNAIKELTWDRGARSVHLIGTDEMGNAVDWTLAEKNYGDGIAWILREARARIPQLLDIDTETADEVDVVSADAGELLMLEPLQVVGKRCAQCDGVLAYEPEGRVCPQCERVYHKAHVPDHLRLRSAHREPASAQGGGGGDGARGGEGRELTSGVVAGRSPTRSFSAPPPPGFTAAAAKSKNLRAMSRGRPTS